MKSEKKLNNNSAVVFLLFPFLLITACNKLIDIPASPSDKIATSVVFADSATAMGAVAGIYNNFDVSGSFSFHNGGITLFTGLSGDELIVPASAYVEYNQFYNNNILSTSLTIGSLWSNAYSSIYQINACLEGISASTGISSSLKSSLTAELKVDRALYYFNLVNIFGPVPLVLSTGYKTTSILPRASVDSIYGQVIADLQSAQKSLSANYPSDGHLRPNLYVADALLAKVYLYHGNWKMAENMADSVIIPGGYSLTDLSSVFLDGSSEAIWQLPGNGSYNQTAEAANFVPTDDGITVATDEVPSFYLSASLLNAFETDDQRKAQWIGVSTVTENNQAVSYYFPYKYKNISTAAATTEDYMILRLGEIYLVRAEARARQGNLSDALSDLNLIRNRAGLQPIDVSSQTEVLSAIMHERQVEMFCEWGNRWYDLNRTGVINNVLGKEKTGWDAKDALFPIPLIELQSNPFLIQNKGY